MPYPQLVTSKRAEDARLRIEFEERVRRQEAVQAQRLIDDFLVMARAQGDDTSAAARSTYGRPRGAH